MRAPAETALRLSVDLSTRTLTVMKDGETVQTYGVAIGMDGHPTPTGSFGVRKVVWNPSWIPPDSKWARGKTAKGPGEAGNPMRTVKIFFREPDFFIHGTGNTESLGSAASHGCLRMDPDQAAELALMLMEDNGVARDWDWVKGILHMGESRTVSLDRSVPMDVIE
jgi:lipoprotein-anchoring transpeptidase ErfK/SrfK